jgi:hypothetical protein
MTGTELDIGRVFIIINAERVDRNQNTKHLT